MTEPDISTASSGQRPESPSVRSVGAKELMPLVRELIDGGASFPLMVSGNSMAPFLHDGRDSVIITALGDKPLRRGDIAFFIRPGGEYVMHRVVRVCREGVYFLGDAQTETEGPVPHENVVAAVNTVVRDGRIIRRGSPEWWLFAHWRTFRPLAPVLSPIYHACCPSHDPQNDAEKRSKKQERNISHK